MKRSMASSHIVLALLIAASAHAQPKSYRLPSVDIKPRVIWGAASEEPEGAGLSFGGQDQEGDDGVSHTKIKVNGEWVDIRDELWAKHVLTPSHRLIAELAADAKVEMAVLRAAWLGGKLADDTGVAAARERWKKTIASLAAATQGHLDRQGAAWTETDRDQLARVIARLKDLAAGKFPPHEPGIPSKLEAVPALIAELHRIQTALEQCAEPLAAEPPARALSPIVYDAKAKLYVLFGGDHLDYLTNDTWVFDPATKRWSLRHPKSAPPARANHKLTVTDGKITLSEGYTYTSTTSYTGGQYRGIGDGDWIYDIAGNTWLSATDRNGVAPLARTYRTGALHTDFFLAGPAPDRKSNAEKLESLPANTWVSMKPPQLPEMNRDWGSAVYDPERDLILRFSGGHSAHGGSDVLHYHCATNRWELPFPVEFPLGQTYTNTEYPRGFNFNRRPWVTGHTYQSYGYEPNTKLMLFSGEAKHSYIWDPDLAEWTGRLVKPKGMNYGDSFYTLTHVTTKHGLICWTQEGKLFRFDHDHREWVELPLTVRDNKKLPGSSVDNSTLCYDSKRDRLYFFRKPYGDKVKYDGVIHTVDFATMTVSTLPVENAAAGSAVSYLCQIRYDEANDVLLVGNTLTIGEEKRTPVFDLAKNQWQTWKITGDDPNGKSGRNVSLGLMYDAKRKLFWAVDTKSNVFALRLEPAKADAQVMK